MDDSEYMTLLDRELYEECLLDAETALMRSRKRARKPFDADDKSSIARWQQIDRLLAQVQRLRREVKGL